MKKGDLCNFDLKFGEDWDATGACSLCDQRFPEQFIACRTCATIGETRYRVTCHDARTGILIKEVEFNERDLALEMVDQRTVLGDSVTIKKVTS